MQNIIQTLHLLILMNFFSLYLSRGQYLFKQKHNEKPEFSVYLELKATR